MRIRTLTGVVAVAAVVVAAVPSCGPSELARAYDGFYGAAAPLLEGESKVWEQIAGLAEHQEDARAVARYRAHLQDKALPFYARFEKDVHALVPGNARLEPARAAMVEYAKARRDFVGLEIRRIEIASAVEQLPAIQEAEELTNSTRTEYVQLVGDDVPDPRFADVGAQVGDFVRGPYRKAVTGAMDASEAVAVLRRDVLPRLERLRNDRYDDRPVSRALRRHVVACDDFLRLLADTLPKVGEVLQAKSRVEAAQADAIRHREEFQKVLRDVQRER